MRAQKVSSAIPRRQEADAPYDMANLFPRDTGLPMTIWVSPKGRARHDARVKVCMIPGDRMDPTNTAVVAVRPPRLLHGDLSSENVELVVRWIDTNAEVLIEYWEGRASAVELVHRLKMI